MHYERIFLLYICFSYAGFKNMGRVDAKQDYGPYTHCIIHNGLWRRNWLLHIFISRNKLYVASLNSALYSLVIIVFRASIDGLQFGCLIQSIDILTASLYAFIDINIAVFETSK